MAVVNNAAIAAVNIGVHVSFPISAFVAFTFFFDNFIYFIYLFLAVLGLCHCVQAFSSCGKRELLFIAVHGLLIAITSLCRARALGARASVVVACGLSSCGSQALERRLNSCGAWA